MDLRRRMLFNLMEDEDMKLLGSGSLELSGDDITSVDIYTKSSTGYILLLYTGEMYGGHLLVKEGARYSLSLYSFKWYLTFKDGSLTYERGSGSGTSDTFRYDIFEVKDCR